MTSGALVALVVVAIAIVAVVYSMSRRGGQSRGVAVRSAPRPSLSDRQARIDHVTRSYLGNNSQSGMARALSAGVRSLDDSSEVRDFCARVQQQQPEAVVIPARYRHRIPDEQLLPFFRRLGDNREWEKRPEVIDQLIEELK